jgi:hypothetical protein
LNWLLKFCLIFFFYLIFVKRTQGLTKKEIQYFYHSLTLAQTFKKPKYHLLTGPDLTGCVSSFGLQSSELVDLASLEARQ